MAGYVVLLAAFGVVPTAYGIYFAFTNAANYFAGLSNFTGAARDFRYLPAVGHVAVYLVIWLVALVVFVTGLRAGAAPAARPPHQPGWCASCTTSRERWRARPASWCGCSCSTPPSARPPRSCACSATAPSARSSCPGHLAILFAMIAFWTGAGGWIVVMYGALNNIPLEVIEAARIDGAGGWQIARRIQIPMLRKWIVYMVILAFATGTQLFVEPQLISEASLGVAGRDYSLNQLSYDFAFQNNNVNYAAAISVELLVVCLVVAAVFVTRSRFFDAD